MYIKTDPKINLEDFLAMVRPVRRFNSLKGKGYKVVTIDGSLMRLVREATGIEWPMDLTGVHREYLELTDFKTINFGPYVPRRHSPALGLLLHLGLLK